MDDATIRDEESDSEEAPGSDRTVPGTIGKEEQISGGGSCFADFSDILDYANALPFYFMLIDEEHHILLANRAAQRDFDIDPREILGRYCPKVVHGIDGPYPGCPLEEYAETGGAQEKDFYDPKMGRWVTSAVYPTENTTKDGKKVFIHIIRDVTKRRVAEEELRKSESLLRTVINATNEAIISIDKRGRITLFNPAAERMFDRNKEEMIGKSMDALMPEKFRNKHRRSVKNYFATSKPDHQIGRIVELPGLRSDGTVFPMAISFSTAKIGQEPFIIAVARDITEQKRKEEEMKKQLMKFDLESGEVYLAKEISPILAREAFKDVLKIGYGGLVITRDTPEVFREISEKETDIHWLGGAGDPDDQLRGPEEIGNRLRGLEGKRAVLIERLDYLIRKNGFDEVLSLVQVLRDISRLREHIVILSVDPKALGDRETHMLDKETAEIELREKEKIPADLREILDFIYDNNRVGIKPTYSKIGKGLNLSQPTVRKRIRELIKQGYLTEYIKGNSKIIELTSKGSGRYY